MAAGVQPCPYCNSEVPVPPGTGDGQRIVCNRCGESFPCRGGVPGGDLADAPPVAQSPTAPTAPQAGANRKLALTVVGIMATMALIGFIYAWQTWAFRRANDHPGRGTENEPIAVEAVPPAQLAALRYLPSDTDVVVGIHVAEALEEPTGREFLRRFRPAELLGPGRDEGDNVGALGLERWTGMSLDELDHVVLGLRVRDRLIPQLTLVAQTRRRVDPKAVLDAFKATRISGPQEAFRFKPEKPLETIWPEAVVWFAGDRTLVIGAPAEEWKTVPTEPAPDLGRFSPGLRTVLQERLGPAGQVWVAGSSADWSKTGVNALLQAVKKEDRNLLLKVKSFGAVVTCGREVRLLAVFECADAVTATALEQYLVPKERKPLRLLGTRKETEPIAKELGESLKPEAKDNWLTLQAKASAETVKQALTPRK